MVRVLQSGLGNGNPAVDLGQLCLFSRALFPQRAVDRGPLPACLGGRYEHQWRELMWKLKALSKLLHLVAIVMTVSNK